MKGAGYGSTRIDKRVIAGFHCFQATKFGTGSYRPLTSYCLYVPVIGQYIGQKSPTGWLRSQALLRNASFIRTSGFDHERMHTKLELM